jgi:hypothetical protein
MSIADLIATVVTTPNLPGAACVAEREPFDACIDPPAGRAHDDGYARAIQVCARCPALQDCRRWVTSLPMSRRPHGVTAGLIRRAR